jgi:hypothetical protein
MTEQTAKTTSQFRTKPEPHQFRTIHELVQAEEQEREGRTYTRPTPEQITKWVAEHPGALVNQTLTLVLGYGERTKMPCLAVCWGAEHVYALNVDGTTHRFGFGEVVERP